MRALAEFIMRGRVQAVVVALIGSWFPLISPATVALVSLRRGAQDGIQILIWAMLPAVVSLLASEFGPLMGLITIAGIIVTYLVSLMVRASSSWAYALMAIVALSTLSALVLTLIVPSPAQSLIDVLGAIVTQEAIAREPSNTEVLGFVAYVLAWTSLLSLLLGRWWQALLYNPGGFQAEFHSLQLNPSQAIICLLSAAYCLAVGGDYQVWGSLFALPLFIVGLSIVHDSVRKLGLGKGWLILFYFALILFSPRLLVLSSALMVFVAVVAFMDTWINVRAHIKPRD